jgi:hypothetical protein
MMAPAKKAFPSIGFVGASTLCLPLVGHLGLFIIGELGMLINLMPPTPLAIPIVIVLVYLPTAYGIGYLALAQVLVIWAWKHTLFRSKASALLGFYNVVLLLYTGYVAWWIVTGQRCEL